MTHVYKEPVISISHVAKLANLILSKKEESVYLPQLTAILGFIATLQKINTKNIPETSQVTGLTNVFRKDEIKSSLSQQEALQNAQATYKGYFKVKSVFEQ